MSSAGLQLVCAMCEVVWEGEGPWSAHLRMTIDNWLLTTGWFAYACMTPGSGLMSLRAKFAFSSCSVCSFRWVNPWVRDTSPPTPGDSRWIALSIDFNASVILNGESKQTKIASQDAYVPLITPFYCIFMYKWGCPAKLMQFYPRLSNQGIILP